MAGALSLGLGATILKAGASPARAAPQGPRHLVWVWQFSTDAEPNIVGARLLEHGLGIVLKTHDGLQWMNEYDRSPYAVSGPAQLAVLANYYESAGVPFHAWAVVHGEHPVREAQMAAEVLAGGARSIYLDIEPHSGFWRGSAADAAAYGRELRRLQPNAHVVLSIDPRPWMVPRLPMKEFAAFSNEIAPQQYWRTFNTPANYERFAETGYPVPPEGVTPEFLINVSNAILAPYGLPISHVGQGSTPDANEWKRFIDLAYSAGSTIVSSWRYGVMPTNVFGLLRDVPPRRVAPPASAVAGVYVVQPGDTLGAIAGAHGATIQGIVDANGLADANYIYVGQQLNIPGASGATAGTPTSAPAHQTSGGGRTYTVEAGDTLYGIAGRFGASVDAIVGANGIADASLIFPGQQLVIP